MCYHNFKHLYSASGSCAATEKQCWLKSKAWSNAAKHAVPVIVPFCLPGYLSFFSFKFTKAQPVIEAVLALKWSCMLSLRAKLNSMGYMPSAWQKERAENLEDDVFMKCSAVLDQKIYCLTSFCVSFIYFLLETVGQKLVTISSL